MEPEANAIKTDLIPEQEELERKEYLGTFRWSRSLKFTPLPPITSPVSYLTLSKWPDFISQRITDKQFEPYILDALSYPLSIIYAINELVSKSIVSKEIISSQMEINVAVLGAASKTECRIALESNYFDEIYYYLVQLTKNTKLKVNLYFAGEEVPQTCSYTSTANKELEYIFSTKNTGEFLKEYLMNFNKQNTFLVGMNCGFGAGYLRLTSSWVPDLIKLIKMNYPIIFTYTNNYEDKKGEQAILKDLLGGKIIHEIDDNPFKSVTTYQSETDKDQWACGNYGIYVLLGGERKIFSKIQKLSKEQLEEEIRKVITVKEK